MPKQPKDKGVLLVGIELETLIRSDRAPSLVGNYYSFGSPVCKYWGAKSDGSLNNGGFPGYSPVELVSEPLFLHQVEDAFKALEYRFDEASMPEGKGVFGINGSCGLHLHFSLMPDMETAMKVKQVFNAYNHADSSSTYRRKMEEARSISVEALPKMERVKSHMFRSNYEQTVKAMLKITLPNIAKGIIANFQRSYAKSPESGFQNLLRELSDQLGNLARSTKKIELNGKMVYNNAGGYFDGSVSRRQVKKFLTRVVESFSAEDGRPEPLREFQGFSLEGLADNWEVSSVDAARAWLEKVLDNWPKSGVDFLLEELWQASLSNDKNLMYNMESSKGTLEIRFPNINGAKSLYEIEAATKIYINAFSQVYFFEKPVSWAVNMPKEESPTKCTNLIIAGEGGPWYNSDYSRERALKFAHEIDYKVEVAMEDAILKLFEAGSKRKKYLFNIVNMEL